VVVMAGGSGVGGRTCADTTATAGDGGRQVEDRE